jgi:hypothetical protein
MEEAALCLQEFQEISLTRWMTEFRKDRSSTPQEGSCFSRFHSIVRLGMLWKMWQLFLFCWSVLLRWTFCSNKGAVCLVLLPLFSLLLSWLLWITSSMVSHVIVHYDKHPLTTSGIHVIVKADFWVLSRIPRTFWLPLRAWGWAPSSAHLCPGRPPYSARSNQWSKGSRSCVPSSRPPWTSTVFLVAE